MPTNISLFLSAEIRNIKQNDRNRNKDKSNQLNLCNRLVVVEDT